MSKRYTIRFCTPTNGRTPYYYVVSKKTGRKKLKQSIKRWVCEAWIKYARDRQLAAKVARATKPEPERPIKTLTAPCDRLITPSRGRCLGIDSCDCPSYLTCLELTQGWPGWKLVNEKEN